MWWLAACTSTPGGPGGPDAAPSPPMAGVQVGEESTATSSSDPGRVLVVSGDVARSEFTASDAIGVVVGRDGRGNRIGVRLATMADLDEDGVRELVVSDAEARIPTGLVVVSPRSLSGTFELEDVAIATIRADAELYSVAMVDDLDGDGAEEIVMTSAVERSTVAVHLSTSLVPGANLGPDDAFTRVEDPGYDGRYEACAIGDVDGDGRSDLGVVTREPEPGAYADIGIWSASSLAVGGVFDSQHPDASVLGDDRHPVGCSAPIGDLDGDLHDDLLSVDWVLSGSALQGVVSLSDTIAWPASDAEVRVLSACGDLTGDGISELWAGALSRDGSRTRVEVFDGATLGPRYTLSPLSVSEVDGFSPAVGGGVLPDLDGDGVAELWFARRAEPHRYAWDLYSGASVLDGSWSLDLPIGRMMAGLSPPTAVALDDLDGDGLPELALSDPAPPVTPPSE